MRRIKVERRDFLFSIGARLIAADETDANSGEDSVIRRSLESNKSPSLSKVLVSKRRLKR
jgi:hypothetical protein